MFRNLLELTIFKTKYKGQPQRIGAKNMFERTSSEFVGINVSEVSIWMMIITSSITSVVRCKDIIAVRMDVTIDWRIFTL